MTTERAPTTTNFIKAAKDNELPTLSQQDFERVGLMVNKLGMLEQGVRDRALSIVVTILTFAISDLGRQGLFSRLGA